MKPMFPLLFAALVGFGPRVQAQAPDSVLALLQAVPELPASAEQAATWVDKSGRVVHRPLLKLQAAIAEHRQALQRIAAAQGRAKVEQGEVAVQNLGQGLQDVGIDMQRMATDPAYAQQVQDRVRRMTPAEQMAMAQRMARPLNSDPRFINQAAAIEQDSPVVRAAADAGQAYAQQQPQRFEQQAAWWTQTESAVQRVLARPLKVDGPRPPLEWDNPGCDAGCRAQWEAHAAKVLPLMLARETEALALRRAAVQRQRAAVAPDIAIADKHLKASGFGLASKSAVHQDYLVGYDGAVLAEIESLIERTVDAVRRAAVVPHCGKQAVLVPAAVCS